MSQDAMPHDQVAGAIARRYCGAEPEIALLSELNNLVYRVRGPAIDMILKLAKGPDGGVLRKELALFDLLDRHGVPVPAVKHADPDGSLMGQPFFLMESAGERTAMDWVARPDALAGPLFTEMGSILARVHGIALPENARPPGVSPRDPSATIGRVHAMADWAAAQGLLPADRVARFKALPVPPLGGEALCHGDFHAVQCVVRAGRISAVVDWESAWVGNPFVDVAVAHAYLEFYAPRELVQRFLDGYAATRELPLDYARTYRSVHMAHWLALLARGHGRRAAWVKRAAMLFESLCGNDRG